MSTSCFGQSVRAQHGQKKNPDSSEKAQANILWKEDFSITMPHSEMELEPQQMWINFTTFTMIGSEDLT